MRLFSVDDVLRHAYSDAVEQQKTHTDPGDDSRPIKVLRLRQLRRARELTLNALGQKVGLSPATISDFEHGRSKPSYDNALALATALGCSMEELLELVEVPA